MVTTRGHCTPLRITPEGNTDHWSRGHVLWLFAKQKEKKHALYPTANPPYDGHPSGIVRKSRSAAPPESERRACLRPSTGLHESVRLRVWQPKGCPGGSPLPPYLTCCQRAARSCAGPHAHHLVDKPPIAFTNAGERHAEPARQAQEARDQVALRPTRMQRADPAGCAPALRLCRALLTPGTALGTTAWVARPCEAAQAKVARLFALTWRSPRKSPETTRIACAT